MFSQDCLWVALLLLGALFFCFSALAPPAGGNRSDLVSVVSMLCESPLSGGS